MPRMGTLAGAAGGASATATSTASAPARPNRAFQLGAGSFKVEFGTSCALRSDTVPPGVSKRAPTKKAAEIRPPTAVAMVIPLLCHTPHVARGCTDHAIAAPLGAGPRRSV